MLNLLISVDPFLDENCEVVTLFLADPANMIVFDAAVCYIFNGDALKADFCFFLPDIIVWVKLNAMPPSLSFASGLGGTVLTGLFIAMVLEHPDLAEICVLLPSLP